MTRPHRLPAVLAAALVATALAACSAGTDRETPPPAAPTTSSTATGAERPAPTRSADPTGSTRSTDAPAPPGATPGPGPAGQLTVEQLTVEVVARYPHDPGAFTQGLDLVDGVLFESTGLVGASTVRRVDVADGTVHRLQPLPADVFGEGAAVVGDRVVVLTWRSGVAYVFDRETLAPTGSFRYEGEGWGLCHDGATLLQSDGSDRLTRRDPDTFAVLGTVTVRDGDTPVRSLNELHCDGTTVLANVWRTSRIARIDAATGRVTAWIDAAGLVPDGGGPEDVLNGIAHDPVDDTYLLTGKRWNALYRVVFRR